MIPWPECPAPMLQLIFSSTLNSLRLSLSFTMEFPISFIGIEIIKNRTKIDTSTIESQQTLACCCIFKAIQTSATVNVFQLKNWLFSVENYTEEQL